MSRHAFSCPRSAPPTARPGPTADNLQLCLVNLVYNRPPALLAKQVGTMRHRGLLSRDMYRIGLQCGATRQIVVAVHGTGFTVVQAVARNTQM